MLCSRWQQEMADPSSSVRKETSKLKNTQLRRWKFRKQSTVFREFWQLFHFNCFPITSLFWRVATWTVLAIWRSRWPSSNYSFWSSCHVNLCDLVFIKFAILFCLLFFYADEQKTQEKINSSKKSSWFSACSVSACVSIMLSLETCLSVCWSAGAFTLLKPPAASWQLHTFRPDGQQFGWVLWEIFTQGMSGGSEQSALWKRSEVSRCLFIRTVRLMARFQAHHLSWKCSSNCWKARFRAERLCFWCGSRTGTSSSQGQSRSRTECDCPADRQSDQWSERSDS